MKDSFNCRQLSLAGLHNVFDDTVKLFICAASFETRSLTIPKSLNPNTIGKAIILKNDDVAGTGAANCKNLEAFFGNKSTVLEITKSIAIKTADRIAREVRRHAKLDPKNIYVDVTCMTHETLLIVFSLLTHIFESRANDINYLYCPAAEYDPNVDFEKKWLSRGIKDVRSVLGYPGKLRPSRKSRLLVMVGFEVNRSSALIDVYEPASLGLGYGDDALDGQHQLINRQKHQRLFSSYPMADQFEFSPRDPYQVRDIILDDANKHSELNLIVAPMNSKISTLGAALAVRQNTDIQLCYAPAVMYNFENYSEPGDCAISFKLND